MKKEKIFQLKQEQVEKLQEIGSKLRQVRQQQAVSLEQIAVKTRIQTRLLKAIEEGKIEILPEPIYIKGFIKQFADALGLNGSELASTYPTWPTLLFIKPSWLHLPGAQLRPIHLYLFYVFLVFSAVNCLSYVVSRSTLQVSHAQIYQQQAEQSLVKDNEVETALPQNLGLVNFNKPKTAEPVRVGITLKSKTWLRVVADGKTEFEGVLKEGDQRTWVAKQKLTLLAGDAGGVMVAFNDEKAKEMGKSGKLQKVTFEANRKS
ncbi:MAG: helix-turn-helix domain-containing protein [Chamaesiphon sp.]